MINWILVLQVVKVDWIIGQYAYVTSKLDTNNGSMEIGHSSM